MTRGFPTPVTAGFPSQRASDAEACCISNLPDWCILRTEDNQSGTGFSSIEIWHYFITTELASYESVLCVNQSNQQNAWGLISLNTLYCMKSARMNLIIYFDQIAWWHDCVFIKTCYAAYFIMKIYYHRYLNFTTRNMGSYNRENCFWIHVFICCKYVVYMWIKYQYVMIVSSSSFHDLSIPTRMHYYLYAY